jgi:hypothetical protein
MAPSFLRRSKNFVDRTGQRFGRLVADHLDSERSVKCTWWVCVCDCGNTKSVPSSSLVSGGTRSCGCLVRDANRKTLLARNTTHGLSGTPEYIAWCAMKARCYDKNTVGYKNYGGRGISVCARWLGNNGFVNFLADMGKKPSAKHTVERTNNDGDYCPENCRWATRKEQGNNKRNNVVITINGETMPLMAWVKRAGINLATFYRRRSRGLSIEDSLGPTKDCRFKPKPKS